ncbi:hypothetical protein AGMMS50276_12810 [Synergistales bacterium]|nr:hypothetical protein AGMMS50276_12810 [Synergistales bacterium]
MNDTIKNNPAEDELDAIRLALYEQTKGMTASEVTIYVKEQIAPTIREYNMPVFTKTKSAQPFRSTL